MFNQISVNPPLVYPPNQTSNISPGHSHSLQTSQATTYLPYNPLPNTQIPSVIHTWGAYPLKIISPGKVENHFMSIEFMAIYLDAMAAEESLTRNHP